VSSRKDSDFGKSGLCNINNEREEAEADFVRLSNKQSEYINSRVDSPVKLKSNGLI
jgi:hypothetical protein